MTKIARYGKAIAKPGAADELTAILLRAASDLESEPGCELYLVNQQTDARDVIWVTEVWRSRRDLDAILERIRNSDEAARAMTLVEDWHMIELQLLGGKGP